MPRRIMLSVFALMAIAMSASAADLPAQSRLGAIFEEGPEVRTEVRRRLDRSYGYSAPRFGFNLVPVLPWERGGYTYGSQWDYYNPGPYYGGPYDTDGPRLPYVCGLYGYC
jgi:hypothetical protein